VVLTARLVRGLADVRSVAVSREHSCALTNAGDVYCWGENGRGQVGGASAPRSTCLGAAGDTPCQPTPTRVEGIAHALQIAVSSGRSCALLSDRTLRCWGDVSALGDFPAKLSDVRRIALGALGACALTSQGELSCSGESTAPVRTPEDVPSLAAVQLSSDTENHSSFACFLGKDGGLGCSGDSNLGQLGLGTLVANSTGKRVLEHTKDVALGAEHACALGDDGSVRCWGKNSDGQVGPAPLASPSCGSATCESAPQLVPGLPPIIAIAAGGNLSCALAQDDTFWCWGADPLSLGAPFRVAGPWEPNGQVCAPFVDDIAKSVYEAAASGRACTTDADCVEVPLDLSCSKTCAVATLSRTSASAAASLVAQIDRDICPHARELGCAEPDITCPPSATRVACNAGRCTQRRRD
jgi:alpha-tubulin suppressor-like RCC1 family protein